jgi:iron complex outermembrane receptor protein
VGKSFMNHYSDYSPFDRDDPNDRAQPWQAPDYSVFDLHAGYNVPSSATRGLEIQLFANVFNVFDQVYIQDSLDNSPFNGFDDDHDADDAEVFFGLPRRLTLGASVTY